MTLSPPVFAPLKCYIAEHEPLIWLISLLFTDQFADRETLTRVSFNPAINVNDRNWESAIVPPPYQDRDALYLAAETFVRSNPTATQCLNRAYHAIEQGELAFYVPAPNRWGEHPYYVPDRDVDSSRFLMWAEQLGYRLRPAVFEAGKLCVEMAISRKQSAERRDYSYPPITAEHFSLLQKEPLWDLGSGLLYLLGRRSRVSGKDEEFTDDAGLFSKLRHYANDAHAAGTLRLIQPQENLLLSKVVPKALIEWAMELPLTLPMFEPLTRPVARPPYCTPDMALMYDAIAHFWNDYDLNHPNPHIAPKKQDVVTWLMTEAKRRNLDFSRTRAEHLDTIIRCPESRRGGNTL